VTAELGTGVDAGTDQDALIERLLDQVATEQARLARVLDQLPGVVGTADAPELRVRITEMARDVCDAPVALFVARDEDDDEATLAVQAGITLLRRPAARRAPLLSAAFGTDDLLVIEDVARATTAAAAPLYGSIEDDRPLRSWLAAPALRPTGERVGVLLVGHTRAHAFDARHHHLLGALARHLAVALDGALLVEEHARVAAGLQETLLPPRLPRIEHADVASRYRAAGDTSVIGGDFYDLFPSEDGRWVMAIGDVCGGGPEAAAVTGIARYTLRAVGRSDPRPAPALTALNDAIGARAADSRFCTAIAACVERIPAGLRGPNAGTGLAVTWSNGGHPPPLVLRDDGRVEVLDMLLGPLLGVLPDATFTESRIELAVGDALILYTDGVIEAHRRGQEQFGEDQLAALVATCAGRTADGIARRIELAVIDHIGGPPIDDVAILVLRARVDPAS
jgi:sigma-B regulation protein RsbU (phosphoserine phosphatase)